MGGRFVSARVTLPLSVNGQAAVAAVDFVMLFYLDFPRVISYLIYFIDRMLTTFLVASPLK